MSRKFWFVGSFSWFSNFESATKLNMSCEYSEIIYLLLLLLPCAEHLTHKCKIKSSPAKLSVNFYIVFTGAECRFSNVEKMAVLWTSQPKLLQLIWRWENVKHILQKVPLKVRLKKRCSKLTNKGKRSKKCFFPGTGSQNRQFAAKYDPQKILDFEVWW